MLRSTPQRATTLAISALLGCGRDEPLRPSARDLECLAAPCADGPADASGRDATALKPIGDAGSAADGATPRGGLDGSIPPFSDASASPDAAVAAPSDAAPQPRPLDGLSVCSSPSARSVAFRTDLLAPVEDAPGTGIPAAPVAFRRAWRNAVARTARPGPALLVLSDIGPLPLGTPRAMRVGTPSTHALVDGGEAYTLANEPDGRALPVVSGIYALRDALHVRASLLAATPARLRFFDGLGGPYEIPFVGIALDATFRSDPAGRCTALDIVDLAIGLPSSSLDATLDGASLASLLGAPAAASSIVVVHLAGPAPAADFVEGTR
jgi:hypothetical protein